MAILLTCSQPLTETGTCPAEAWQEINIDALSEAFTFDLPTMELAVSGMLLLFVTGLGIGFIIAQLRRVRV